MAPSLQIIVVGAGEVGQHLARILSKEGHGVTVVDSDPLKIRLLNESLDVQGLVGDGTRADVLTQAGATKADLLVAVTDDDHVNMLACLVSRGLETKRRILRLKETRVLEGYRSFYQRTLGYDIVLSTSELAAREILETVKERHALEVESYFEGRIQMRRLRIHEGDLTGHSLQDLRLSRVVVVGVQRSTDSSRAFFVPGGADVLEAGDQVYVMGKAADLDVFEREAGEPMAFRREVALVGAGGIGREVAARLGSLYGVTVKMIERDAQRARALDQQGLDNVLILHGDATDLQLLQEEHVDSMDVFVAMTGDDEDNLVACQIAHAMGVKRTVAIINKASYAPVYDLMGVDTAISPRLLCAKLILRFVRSSSPQAVSILAEGKAEVLELRVERDAPARIQDLGLHPEAKVGARLRGDAVIVPSGSDELASGDRVIVLATSEALPSVEEALGGRRR